MLVIPALDLRGGQIVRLHQGSFSQETVYSDDPLAVALEYAAAGARRLHVVDLDGARGHGENRSVVHSIVSGCGIEVQVAGGVRSREDVRAWLDAGAAAVVMGTTAARDPETLLECALEARGKILAALDVKNGLPAVTGWTAVEPVSVESLLERWNAAALGGVIVTSIEHDGTMWGPDLSTLRTVLPVSRHPVTYSGGIASLGDIQAVKAAGAAGVLVGKALYERRIDLQSAVAIA